MEEGEGEEEEKREEDGGERKVRRDREVVERGRWWTEVISLHLWSLMVHAPPDLTHGNT